MYINLAINVLVGKTKVAGKTKISHHYVSEGHFELFIPCVELTELRLIVGFRSSGQ